VAKCSVSFGHSVEHSACRSLLSAMASCLSELQPSFAMVLFPPLHPIFHGHGLRSAQAIAFGLLKPRPLVSNGLLFTIASPVSSFIPWFLSFTVTASGLPWPPFYHGLLSAIVTATGLPWPPFCQSSGIRSASYILWPPVYPSHGLRSSMSSLRPRPPVCHDAMASCPAVEVRCFLTSRRLLQEYW
jgi:hypothetical protein